MGRDDYYSHVCKILVFLYAKLKGKETRENTDYISPYTKYFPISKEYLDYVVEQLFNDGYVDKVLIYRAWGGDIVMMDISRMRITPKGIDYLSNNSTLLGIAENLKEAAKIWSLFA